jgi:hypothetical protein
MSAATRDNTSYRAGIMSAQDNQQAEKNYKKLY